MSSVIGVFDSQEQAEKVLQELKGSGYSEEGMSLVAKEDENAAGNRQQGEETGEGMGYDENRTEMISEDQKLTSGTTTGGAIGGVAGLLAGAGTLAIPGVGPIIAAGPIAAGLSGAAAGGLTGALVDYGIPKEVSKDYKEQIRGGNMLAIYEGVRNEEEVTEIATIMQRNGAIDVENY
ncbi:hypothetical protein [Sporohalobacter salinus]|uniref:hypothetical protein n=1 Tax=Sporohalobacter salinus TaxID=1494606 RepID=UPI001961BB55|nr:hypothetical protein [Sporohalobacter salinus]MBM7623460.1 putative membrane protein [Sporohalobacter salinus]